MAARSIIGFYFVPVFGFTAACWQAQSPGYWQMCFDSGVFSCGEAFKEGTLYWVINIPFFISEVYKEKFAPRGRSRLDNCAKVSACKLRMPDTCVVVPTRYKSFLCKLLELKNRYYPIQFSPAFLFHNSFPKLKTSHQRFHLFLFFEHLTFRYLAIIFCSRCSQTFQDSSNLSKKMDGEWV